jgi:hypothetical protein
VLASETASSQNKNHKISFGMVLQIVLSWFFSFESKESYK